MTSVATLAYIDAAGYHFSDYPTFLQFVQDGYTNIYGDDVYLGADSQDGQWTAFLAQALYDTAALGASCYNSFSPAGAQGVGLSKAVLINGLNRNIPTYSTVTLTIVGVANTTITNGNATDTLGQVWLLPQSVTIPSGGAVSVTATAQNIGAVFAAANTVTSISTPTNGWQTVNNPSAAIPGSAVEEDGALRARQAVSTANPSQTVLEGTYGAVANVPGVTNVAVWENFTSTPDSNEQPDHSILVVCEGGDPVAVADAIQVHKTPGTNPWVGPSYKFTTSSASATAGATYSNNGFVFTVSSTIAGGTTLQTTGTGVPSNSGTLTKVSGTGDATITFSLVANAGGSSQSQTVYDSHGVPTEIGFFSPPEAAEIGVQVSLTPGVGWTTDFETTIALQVAAAINALGIGAGNQYGGYVRVNPLYAQVYVPNYVPSMYIVNSIEISINGGSFSTSDISINFVQLPVTSPTPGVDVVFVL